MHLLPRRVAYLFTLVAGFALPAAVLGQMPAVTIHAARLLDGRGNTLEDVLVTIEKGRIIKVERAGADTKATYDLKDLTLLPGLIDTHAHPVWYFNREGRYHAG